MDAQATKENQVPVTTTGNSGTLLLSRPAQTELSAKLEALLHKVGFEIKPTDVPSLSVEWEEELIRRYRDANSIPNKETIWGILGYGGGLASALILTNALVEEFSGKNLSAPEHFALLRIPIYLGILAHREDAAFQFLREAINKEFWASKKLWICAETGHVLEQIHGRCISSLPLSGRPAARHAIDHYWDHPEEATGYIWGSVVDAAFCSHVIKELGWERAIGEILFDPSNRSRNQVAWYETPEGGAWWIDYREAVRAVEESENATRGSP
jgi:hypothetical protein